VRPKFVYFALALSAVAAWGQKPAQTPADEPVTFRASVQLVTIPVVVRDKQGRAVGTLQQGDFQLSDNGKRQEIARFSLEQAGDAGRRASVGAVSKSGARQAAPPPLEIVPDRFIAYVFDDMHLAPGDLMRVRDAAGRHLLSALRPGDRAALYSTSGVLTVEFTSDRDALRAGLARLTPRPLLKEAAFGCPTVGYYQADLMVNKNEPTAVDIAIKETILCSGPGTPPETARKIAMSAARIALAEGGRQSQMALGSIYDAIRRMEVMAGQRNMVLVSPGFLTPDLRREILQLMQAAIHARVKVSALDARGLYTDPAYDASLRSMSNDPEIARVKASFITAAAFSSANVMGEISSGTGGRFFENSNDLDSGFERLAAAPEYVYMLAFSPTELKFDGKYHSVKVTLKNAKGLSAEARQGYYAPMRFSDPKAQASHEIREAVFSREEVNELPVELLAQYFKHSDKTAQITVHARVFPHNLKLRKADGRSYDEVRIVSTVFDTNGKLVAGKEALLDLRMRDETLEQTRETGIVVRSDFDEVKPGAYLVRMVVRDAEGQQISSQNSVVGP
jgi:VWFA-related protein